MPVGPIGTAGDLPCGSTAGVEIAGLIEPALSSDEAEVVDANNTGLPKRLLETPAAPDAPEDIVSEKLGEIVAEGLERSGPPSSVEDFFGVEPRGVKI